MICDTVVLGGRKQVNLACGIEAVYMYFNGTGIWGGDTIYYIDSNKSHFRIICNKYIVCTVMYIKLSGIVRYVF